MASDRPTNRSLRPLTESDAEFAYRVFASTRADEVALTGWPAAQQESFLRQQYQARCSHYRQAFPDATNTVILVDETAIGLLSVNRTPDEIRVVDLALLPSYRGRGIGAALVRELQAEAAATDRPLRLQVFNADRAVHLYTRLGFEPVGDNGMYIKMEWRAARG